MTVDGGPLAGAGAAGGVRSQQAARVWSRRRSDPHGRQRSSELVAAGARLYPVGRLDADVSGLILLTDDGELANRLSHPRFEVPRTYRATWRNPPVREPALVRYGKASSSRTARPRRRRARRLRPATSSS